VVLFSFGTGPIKGFAVTLSLGILTSMFTAIMGTRAVINLIYGGRAGQRVCRSSRESRTWSSSNQDANRLHGQAPHRGGDPVDSADCDQPRLDRRQPRLNFGIDFTGGTLIEVAYPVMDLGEVRAALAEDFADAQVQHFGSPRCADPHRAARRTRAVPY
jgi:preprotein translocase subunit SecF